tara:strand:+ start:555 stop:875 length:321 start_codon:yes stop_codon:yes gene_type:complete
MAQRLEEYTTYIWQVEARKKYYRIQTDDHRVSRKLKKRPNAKLCMYGINAPFWIFELSYNSPKYAVIGLSNITGADVKETDDMGVFVSYTPKQLTIENDSDPIDLS